MSVRMGGGSLCVWVGRGEEVCVCGDRGEGVVWRNRGEDVCVCV